MASELQITVLGDLHQLPPEEQERIRNLPGLSAPEGVDHVFENLPNKNDLLLDVVSIGLVVDSAAFLLRTNVRAIGMRHVSVEDGTS
jgi:hypothetical protein